MSLKFPDSDIDFEVTPAFFLGDFDIFDREESLGEYLNNFDPNDKNQLQFLLDEKFFRGARLLKFTEPHKYKLMKTLEESLSDSDFDFDAVLNGEDEYFCLPGSWNIKNPRDFFNLIYDEMFTRWGENLIIQGYDILIPER